MPGGENLTPATLNNWLKTQSDGYIADGLVNWWAVTRLVKILSNQSTEAKEVLENTSDTPVISEQLPMLEFSTVKENVLQAAEVFIRSNNPVIAQTPGHFVVMNGFYKDTDDFVVVDPLFPKIKASEYEEIQSLRIFQPSFTDLSTLVVVHDSTFQVNVYDEVGNEQQTKTWSEFLEKDLLENFIANVENVGEDLDHDSSFSDIEKSNNQSAEVFFTVIEKPISGKYIVEFIKSNSGYNLNNNQSQIFSKIYAYSAIADVSLFTLENNNLLGQKIVVDFEKNSSTGFNYFYNWDYFLEKLNIFFEQEKISEIARNRLIERVTFIQNLNLEKKQGEEGESLRERRYPGVKKNFTETSEIEKLAIRIQRHQKNLELLLEFYSFYSDENAITELEDIAFNILNF